MLRITCRFTLEDGVITREVTRLSWLSGLGRGYSHDSLQGISKFQALGQSLGANRAVSCHKVAKEACAELELSALPK